MVAQEISEWHFANRHAADVLAVLQKVDDSWKEKHEVQMQENKEQCRRDSIISKQIREENRRHEKHERTAQVKVAKATHQALQPAPIPQPSQQGLIYPPFPHHPVSPIVPMGMPSTYVPLPYAPLPYATQYAPHLIPNATQYQAYTHFVPYQMQYAFVPHDTSAMDFPGPSGSLS